MEPLHFCCRMNRVLLTNVTVRLHDNGELSIVFYEDNSEFDGNNFEYRYSLDAGNANTFLIELTKNIKQI